MRPPTKTVPRIRWADGTTGIVWREGRMWTFRVPVGNGGEHATDSMWGLKDAVESYGGTVERVPNPHYDQQRKAYEARQLRRMFRPYLNL